MLNRLSLLPKIGFGTFVIALIASFAARAVYRPAGAVVFWVVFAGILGTVLLSAIVGPRARPAAAPDLTDVV